MGVFEAAREKYGLAASWAVWAPEGARAKSNMGDLSIFEGTRLYETCKSLHTRYVLVGLNISTIDIEQPLSNFHGENGEVYKARYALRDTPLWGSYMTDVIKDHKETEAVNMVKFLRSNPDYERKHILAFTEELRVLNASSPVLVAFGRDVFAILQRHLSNRYRIAQIPHYAWRTNKENYRKKVLQCIDDMRL